MGARGGYKRVVRFECTTCQSDHHTTVADAVRCCNEAIHAKEEANEKAKVQRNMKRVVTPRVTFSREYRGACLRAVAVGRCPMKNCTYGKYEVTVPLENFYRTKKMTKEEAKKKAVALVKAQIARHLKSRWSH